MKQDEATLLAEIQAFLATAKMAETTFGRFAVDDGMSVARVRGGGGVTLTTARKVRQFIRDHCVSTEATAA